MTSLLPSSTRPPRTGRSRGRSGDAPPRVVAEQAAGPPRPLVLLATLGGVGAAASTLLVCLAVGVVGWFATDAGGHGTPRDGLRAGALGWLTAHGSGVRVDGVVLAAVPLGVTALVAWTIWRLALRVGAVVSGHGPDADRIVDGERDWTVLVAGGSFTLGYVGVAWLTIHLAATPATAPSLGSVLVWSVLLCLLLAVPALAVGSGRAAIWISLVPETVRASFDVARRTLVWWLSLAALVFVVALAIDLGTAANVLAQLHTSVGEAVLLSGLSLLLVPNAVLFSGAYLLGPGFAVGAGTAVTPAAVTIGPLPMFPLLAALPETGAPPAWTSWLVAAPFLLAAAAAARSVRVRPTWRFEEAAVRGAAGGVLAGIGFGALSLLAGGAVGPGRMRDVGPPVLDVFVHAVTSLGIGGLIGALLAVAAMRWSRRRTPAEVSPSAP